MKIGFGGLRIDKHFTTSILTLEGGYATLEGPVFQTGIGRVQVTDVERPWARLNFNLPHWNFSGYYDARVAENQSDPPAIGPTVPTGPGSSSSSCTIGRETHIRTSSGARPGPAWSTKNDACGPAAA